MHPDDEYETIMHRDMSIVIWRTDDPMEPPGDDPDAEGPFEIGDFYCAVAEWGLQTGATVPTFRQALALARSAVDAVLDEGADPVSALRLGDAAPLPFEPPAPSGRPAR